MSVFAISALDCYVHDLVVAKALWIIKSASTTPLRFDKLKTRYILLFDVHTNGKVDESYKAIESSLRKSLSWQSFQHPDKISEIIGRITDNNIWQELANNTRRNLSFREGSWNLRGTTKNDCPLACSAEYRWKYLKWRTSNAK